MPNFIKELRKARGWSQEDLARALSFTNQHVSYLETGKRQLSESTIRRLAETFGCSYAQILDGRIEGVEDPAEMALLEHFRLLNDAQKKALVEFVRRSHDPNENKPAPENEAKKRRNSAA